MMYADDLETVLYLTQHAAYLALAEEIYGGDSKFADALKQETLAALVATGRPIDADVIEAFDKALEQIGLIARVTIHEHPWKFA